MSRIGKKSIIIPTDVDVHINNADICISGPKDNLKYTLPEGIKIKQNTNTLELQKINTSKKAQALYGLSRTIINNMIIGVSEGFSKKLAIEGVGYRSQMQSNTLILNVGYSHQININIPKSISVIVENSNLITIQGADKAAVGELAAKVRAVRKPEPYKGKGIRYIDEKVQRKIGKAGK